VLEVGGLVNWHITARVILKLEVHTRYWVNISKQERTVAFPGTMTFFEAQLAVAF
jgi:hypothetical protein